jgi:carboxypeptidase Taq
MTGPEKKLQELKIRLLEIGDLNHINALLNWDQSTYMPPGGAEVCVAGTNGAGKIY